MTKKDNAKLAIEFTTKSLPSNLIMTIVRPDFVTHPIVSLRKLMREE